jgi:hypothetical protein
MRSLSTPALPFAAPRQFSMSFDSGRLRGISPSDRRTALTRLTCLLLEATGLATEERDDDER